MIGKPETGKKYKILFVGDSSVGKSSLINRLIENSFSSNIRSTQIIDLKIKIMNINNTIIKALFFDTPGRERIRNIIKNQYKSSDIILCVYDITNKRSFDSIQNFWLDQMNTYGKKNKGKFVYNK